VEDLPKHGCALGLVRYDSRTARPEFVVDQPPFGARRPNPMGATLDRNTEAPRRPRATFVGACLLAFAALELIQCAPAPRTVHCANDGQCADLDVDFRYCAAGRCVECVTNSACGAGSKCSAGACVER
jgi:hypothetical protein